MTQAVEAVFTSPGIMIAGFTHPPTADASHQAGAADLPHGLDLPAIKQVGDPAGAVARMPQSLPPSRLIDA